MTEVPEIELRHRKQLSTMRGWLDGRGYYKAMDALELVRGLEVGTRKDGQTPKFHHQLSIARLITTLAPHLLHPEETIVAAFLHDVIEDHGDTWTPEKLEERFGHMVAEAVWKLSKKAPDVSKEYPYYFGEMCSCPIASIVKLADRSHNLQTMQGVFSVEKQKAYVEDVEVYFLPMGKVARRNFPQQYPAYENLKILLRCQCELIQCILTATEQSNK